MLEGVHVNVMLSQDKRAKNPCLINIILGVLSQCAIKKNIIVFTSLFTKNVILACFRVMPTS